LRQTIGAVDAKEFVKLPRQRGVKFLPFTQKEAAGALGLNFHNQEDACVAAGALRENRNYIVTRNVRDFSRSPVAALRPATLLRKLKAHC